MDNFVDMWSRRCPRRRRQRLWQDCLHFAQGCPATYQQRQRTARGSKRECLGSYITQDGEGLEEGRDVGFYSLATDITNLTALSQAKSY